QGEGGIRGDLVTGVQTCARPIPGQARDRGRRGGRGRLDRALPYLLLLPAAVALGLVSIYPIWAGVHASLTTYAYGRPIAGAGIRSEERRVGKVGGGGGWETRQTE